MLYLLDASAIIEAHRDYYPMERVPDFWDWLVQMAKSRRLKIPLEIWEEITPHDSRLVEWMDENEQVLVLNEEITKRELDRVARKAYVANPSREESGLMGEDPLLVAHASRDKSGRCVVTTEKSKPGQKGAKRKLPDACKILEVESIHTVELIRRLDFRTELGRRHASN